MASQISTQQAPIHESFTFQSVSKKSEILAPSVSVTEMIMACDMVELTGQGSFNFPNYPEANKNFQVLYFRLASDFESLKGLFNGLISIGQPNGVMLEFEKELNRYTLKFYSSNEPVVLGYFSKITKVISEEIRFKKILKRIIENQKSFEAEGQLLRNEIFA
ncbi:hypothetical protein MMU07_07830 [Aquiflexum sp. LQ15W]|uniref:hypothetical protein n=1 Tax=Cognataquiflexum nitidum TaxID=2922272 RepID=UPI001F144317|nr:hypothetical protein [Cognataquiflexum nitidum]MCH6199482.1 hypothetical protein [Cognataquiflexum nitidum]